jgi:alkanesulfonate monooxygenase SsuD/methylene tetrahydromethanopterin reductase-like flavin-dependent oxidoreductase (luciferase family)
MKFGAFLWQRRGEDLAANARLAEQLGFESVWMGEHLGFPIEFKSAYPYDESGIPPVRNYAAIHDPLMVLPILPPPRPLSSLEPGFISSHCATHSPLRKRSPASISFRTAASFSA